jgi:hypothetical protein
VRRKDLREPKRAVSPLAIIAPRTHSRGGALSMTMLWMHTETCGAPLRRSKRRPNRFFSRFQFRCSLWLALLVYSFTHFSGRAATFPATATADTFVRAQAPTINYGGAGALAVSGADAANAGGVKNGQFDTFLRFSLSAMVSQFDQEFGPNGWTITGALLRVTEVGAPINTIFNRGVGGFDVLWVDQDDWLEGSGGPNAPATTGLNQTEALALLETATTVNLGSFTNALRDDRLGLPLSLPAGFASDLVAGGEVTLHLTATSATTGFTFYARNFGSVTARPVLEISAGPSSVRIAIRREGDQFIVTGQAGTARQVLLGSSDLTRAVQLWQPISTNMGGGSFSFTVAASSFPDAGGYFAVRAE